MNENTSPIPADHVRITVTTSHFSRTRNGAWVGAGATNRVHTVPLSEAPKFSFGRCDTVTLEYSDGLYENLDMANDPVRFFSTDPAAGFKTSRALGRIGYYGPGRD